jgi:hypothetical protein
MSSNPQTPGSDPKPDNLSTGPHKELYDLGYEMRKKVVGEEHVARSLAAGSSEFMRPMQMFATGEWDGGSPLVALLDCCLCIYISRLSVHYCHFGDLDGREAEEKRRRREEEEMRSEADAKQNSHGVRSGRGRGWSSRRGVC